MEEQGMADSGGGSLWARYKRADSTLIAFSLIGSTLVILSFLALATITLTQLADLPFLIKVATDTRVINSILLTFGAGLTVVFILLLFGTPLAYVLARTHSRVNSLVEALIDIPLVLPHTVAGIMVYLLFMQRGLLGAPFKEIGIVFEDAFPGIVVAMLFVSIPFYVNTVREGFQKVPVHIENVARTLGATRFRAFILIVLPLSARQILNGSVLAWGRAISEFAAVIMIAYYPMIVSTLIYYRFTTGGLRESSAIAFLMILASFSIFLVLRIATRYLGRYDDRV
ncbi:MAG TPA: ABC transporter permease [Methanoregulaceae archaeon]|jgi:molybdate/tungstate transport system permease protein|nr:ABC transporter permease [Methanoregulaceae archaeon]